MGAFAKILTACVLTCALSGCGDTPSAATGKPGGTVYKGEKGPTLTTDKLDELRKRGSRQNF